MRRALLGVGVAGVLLLLVSVFAGWWTGGGEGMVSPLPYDYEVPSGAQLVGVAFPITPMHARGVDGPFYQAVLAVDGPLDDVVADLLRQASSKGEDVVARQQQVCYHDGAHPTPRSPDVVCLAGSDADEPLVPGVGARFNVFASQSESPPASYLSVTFGPPRGEGRGQPPPEVVLPETLPDVDFPPLPQVGESFGSEFLFGIEVLPGSALAMHPYWNGGLTGGFSAVLKIDGNPDKVFDGYERQASGLTNETGHDSETYAVGRTRVRVSDFDSAGGPKVRLVMADADDHGVWLYIGVGND